MERDKELSPVTIYGRCWWVTRFLNRLQVKGSSLHKITLHRIDMAFQKMLDRRLFAEDDSKLGRRAAGFLSFCGSTGLVP